MWIGFVISAAPGIAWGGKARLAGPAESLGWSADSRYVVASSASGGALRVDLRGRSAPVPVEGLEAIQLSPEGRLVLGVKDQAFVSVDLETDGVETIPLPELRGRPVIWMRGPFGDVVVSRTVAHYSIWRSGGRSSDVDAAPTRNFRAIWLDPVAPIAYVDTGFGLEARHLRTGLTLRTLDSGRPGQRYVGAVRDPEGRLILAVEDQGGFRLWVPPEAPGPTWEISPEAPKSMSGDGRQLAVGEEDRVTIYGTATRQIHQELKTRSAVVRVAFSPDGQTVAAALADGSVRLWPVSGEGLALPVDRPSIGVDTGRLLAEDPELPELVIHPPTRHHSLSGATARLSWAPNGELVGWVGGALVEIDPESGEERPLPIAGAPSRPFAWSADGSRLAAVADSGVALYDTRGWKLVRLLDSGGGHGQLGWGGGVIVADAGSGRARSWDARTSAARGEPFGFSFEAVSRFELSPDGEALAVTGRDPRVLSSEGGAPIASLDAQWGGVVAACWSRDGARLATAGADGTILVWDTEAWEPTAMIEGANARELAFSPDGDRLVSASWDGGLVADVATGRLEAGLRFDGLLGSLDWGAAGISMADTSGNLYLWAPAP